MERLLTSGNASLDLIVWAMYVGFLIGIALALVVRVHQHRVVRALLLAKAEDPAAARTLRELKLDRNWIVRYLLKPNSPLMKYLTIANPEEAVRKKTHGLSAFWHRKIVGDGPFDVIDLERARFYIREEKHDGAEIRFRREKGPILSFLLAAILLFFCAILILQILPSFINAYTSLG